MEILGHEGNIRENISNNSNTESTVTEPRSGPITIETVVINLIAGPSSGKTTLAAFLFYKLKSMGYLVEYVPEVAKGLVWKGEFDILNNQHYVSSEQYKLLASLKNKVNIIITDGSLIHGLYYNRFNVDNTSNIDKTESKILEYYYEFKNINIFLERGNYEYETAGRMQTELEANQIDTILLHLMDKKNIPYTKMSATIRKPLLRYVIEEIKNTINIKK